jgi:predicted NAD/FAD-dependent oxidoreductase
VTSSKSIAIIGAGIAGLSCATALQKAGFEVTLFEKSRGVSGRLSTRATENWQCDHGAQYFTARDSLFDAEVQRWIDHGVAQEWQPLLKVFDGNSLLAKQSESNTTRYVGYPQNNAPAKFLAKTLHVVTETTVIGIYKQAGKWLINAMEHGIYPDSFDDVILAIPAPQAATLLKNTTSDLLHLCHAVVMRPCFALMLQYDHTIPCQFDGLFIQAGALSWVARDSAKPGRKVASNISSDVWVLHASAEWSASHVDDDKEKIAREMRNEFNHILKIDDSIQASAYAFAAPKHQSLHRWLYADAEKYLTDICHYDISERIGICGDWVNGGKVQGAWLSGLHLANQLITEHNSF